MKENKKFIGDCNDCISCNLTEEEQDYIYIETSMRPDHKCLLHNKRILHNCQENGHLYPCKECGGWDYVDKNFSKVITPYIRAQIEYTLKKECKLQSALGHTDRLKELQVALTILTGEIPDINDLWSNSRYLE